VVQEGKTGLLVPARSPEAMARALLTLLSDPGLARRMGQAGRNRVEAIFDIRKTARNYAELYQKLLSIGFRPMSEYRIARGKAGVPAGLAMSRRQATTSVLEV
jgi:hypothetical protein